MTDIGALLAADFLRIQSIPYYEGVHIDGDGTKSYASKVDYQIAVKGVLERIHNSRTGQLIFNEVNRRPAPISVPTGGLFPHLQLQKFAHTMTVIPYEKAELNAFASPTDLQAATPKGQTEHSGKDGSVLKDAKGNDLIGTGTGSDVKISFTPIQFSKYCAQKGVHKCGAQPDETLFHEMVHGIRDMLGLLNPIALGFLYDTEEEFFAIVLANIYASETGRPLDIRADHHGFEHLTTDTDATFLPKKDVTDYRYRLIDKFVHQQGGLAVELSKINCAFNPLRRYFQLQGRSISASAPFLSPIPTSFLNRGFLNSASQHVPIKL